jgi:hypothetical protein
LINSGAILLYIFEGSDDMDTMYAGKVNSPATTLDGAINDSVQTINVIDGSILPAAPNLAVIGTGEDAETILYGVKTDNALTTVTRGFQGTAKAWDSGTAIARMFTAYDYDTLKANISELDSVKIESVVEDTTPELGGEMDAGAHSIGFTQQIATGDGTTTIDWKLGIKFYFTFGAFNEVFTFTAPSKPCNLTLILKQDATGSRTATWPATVMFPAGTKPTLSTGANKIDMICFYWDGTNYFGASLLAFAVPA